MNVSDAGLQFIMEWEGTRNTPYDDGGPGIGNCTVGVGHLLAYRPCTPDELAQNYTDAQVMELLREDVARFESYVNSHANLALNQNQYDALVDFCFNCGGGYPRVWDAVNNGGDVADVLAVTAVMPQWAHDALVRRRKAEGVLYNTPVEEEAMTADEKAQVDALAALVWNHGLQINEFGKAFFPLAMAFYTNQQVDVEQQARIQKLETELNDLSVLKP